MDICEHLEGFDKAGVIFAERVAGDFTPHSRAEVIPQNSDELQNRGLSYCLEISIARDAVEVWSRWRDGQQPSTAQRAEAVCYKANTDAWGPPNFIVQGHEPDA
jgi:hypothetical protein